MKITKLTKWYINKNKGSEIRSTMVKERRKKKNEN